MLWVNNHDEDRDGLLDLGDPEILDADGTLAPLAIGPLEGVSAAPFQVRAWTIWYPPTLRLWTRAADQHLLHGIIGPVTPPQTRTINGELYHRLDSGQFIAAAPPAGSTFLVEAVDHASAPAPGLGSAGVPARRSRIVLVMNPLPRG
jgi:hypothetical protein